MSDQQFCGRLPGHPPHGNCGGYPPSTGGPLPAPRPTTDDVCPTCRSVDDEDVAYLKHSTDGVVCACERCGVVWLNPAGCGCNACDEVPA